jgi:hypothetical protein
VQDLVVQVTVVVHLRIRHRVQKLISKVVLAYQFKRCAGLLPVLVPELPDHGMAALSGSTHLPTSSLSSHAGNGSRRFDQLSLRLGIQVNRHAEAY